MVSNKYIYLILFFLSIASFEALSQKRLATADPQGYGYNSAILAEIISQELGDSVLLQLNEKEPRCMIIIDYRDDNTINKYTFFGQALPEILKNEENQERIIKRLKKESHLYCVSTEAHLGLFDLGESDITLLFNFRDMWLYGPYKKKEFDLDSIKSQIIYFKSVEVQSMDEYVLETYLKLLKEAKKNEKRRKIFLDYIKKNICKCSDVDEKE